MRCWQSQKSIANIEGRFKDTRLKFWQQVLLPYIFAFCPSLSARLHLPSLPSSSPLPPFLTTAYEHPLWTWWFEVVKKPSLTCSLALLRNLWTYPSLCCMKLISQSDHVPCFTGQESCLSFLSVSGRGPRVPRWCWQIRLAEDRSPRTSLHENPCSPYRKAQGFQPLGWWCPPAIRALDQPFSIKKATGRVDPRGHCETHSWTGS